MDDLTMWSLLVGFVSPPLISMVQQPAWSRRLRALVTLAFSTVVGGGTAYFNGAMTGKGLVSAILVVLVTALTTYKGLWKPSGVSPAVETATSPQISNEDDTYYG